MKDEEKKERKGKKGGEKRKGSRTNQGLGNADASTGRVRA